MQVGNDTIYKNNADQPQLDGNLQLFRVEIAFRTPLTAILIFNLINVTGIV
jgi:hypothetical protein